jgi:putative transposase
VIFYSRRLPHLQNADQATFLTWRLHGSLPPNRAFPEASLNSGEAFTAMDRLLDEARTGPVYLRQPAIADMVVEVIRHNADMLKRYDLHAYAVMPNHVHMLISPHIPLPLLTKALKGFTAKLANQMLHLTGTPFWQQESYDRLVRDHKEFERIRRYIEENPVWAGLVAEASEYRWSSAEATGRSPADQEVRPTSDQDR